MKKISIVFRHSPYGTTKTREGIDFALLSASFEQQVSLIFCDEAVLHLLPNQQAELAGSKDYVSVFKAFELYEIETILACKQSLDTLGIKQQELAIDVQIAEAEAISESLVHADEVLVF
ncbi:MULTISPECIES: sulfurtransferase complex subunit TusC [Pseudomonadati]|uniref:Sulfurtransferase complex subunit TusC n=1 Tax=Shewanella aestuarii TaxID=1028752 RepID=A0ABT0KWU2_9GAMM|nr:sulfurtransferase complex subunit TusC [Shewanella aestuarii]MCL1115931.1 sulfurtransferase complex subunit TusC [Shewanella aestuarii]GGN69567.1 sulfurtransferase TusC [Shewanella aestuarii]